MADELTGVLEHQALASWVGRFGSTPVPVLPQSIARLAELKKQEESVRPRDMSQAVLHDPMLTLTVLRFLRGKRSNRLLADITTVEHAIMLLGVSPFFAAFSELQPVDAYLGNDQAALEGIMGVVARSRHAALHAREWAQLRSDIETDEVIIATLLHDIGEMLLWCIAPRQAEEIQRRLTGEQPMGNVEAQTEVLGFSFNQLQLALAKAWDLPPLLTSLMDDYGADSPRARNVILAVNLARHAANGWEDPALMDDIFAIRRLTGHALLEVRQRLFLTALEAARDRAWYGARAPAVWLPPFPLNVEYDTAGAGAHESLLLLNHVKRLLAADEDTELTGARIDLRQRSTVASVLPALIALAAHGIYKGSGISRFAFLVVDPRARTARTRYLGGSAASAAFATCELPLAEPAPAFMRQLDDECTVWWRGDSDPTPISSLPAAWRRVASPQGFFLARVRGRSALEGLIYCDGAGGPALNETKFTAFREIVHLLESNLERFSK